MTVYFYRAVALVACITIVSAADEPMPHKTSSPLTEQERAEIDKAQRRILDANSVIPAVPSVSAHSKRGDALFFLGRFPQAVDEYQEMVKIDPDVDASHWRLGIALFFADQPQVAVAQFEKYHSFDDVDRENGIWRYLSQFKAGGSEVAQKELLKYAKDDREPFPAVYKLFDGSMTPEQALANIPSDLPATERDKRLFYTELYIGMHMVVKRQTELAKNYLRLAVSRKWPRTSGFGPNYMWHVGRVQLDQLLRADE